jgi:hypothetical protein
MNWYDEEKADIEKRILRLKLIEHILANGFPDLDNKSGASTLSRFYSNFANEKVTEVEYRPEYETKSFLSALPYYIYKHELGDFYIYSKPIRFTVGWGDKYSGWVAYGNWQDELRKAKISEIVIAKIEQYFIDHPRIEE